MKIAQGSIVRIEYEIRVKGGDVIEASTKSGPVQYVHGEGTLLPALEKRLAGLAAGESLEGEIPSNEVIPPEDTLPVRRIPRSEFPSAGPVEVGAMFEAQTATGATINLRVTEMDEKAVTARLLPPLAGKDLSFKVRVIRIEDPVSHLVSVVRKPPPPLPAAAIKLELEADPDPESMPKIKPDSKREPVVAEAAAKSESKVEAKSESKVEAKSESKLAAKSEPPKADPKPDEVSKSESDTKAEPKEG